MLITFILGGLLTVPCLGCGSGAEEVERQVVTVQRGNLVIDITAVGNLALSCTEDLAFEIAGTVEEVLVEEADSVEEGQVLAKLDIEEWEEHPLKIGMEMELIIDKLWEEEGKEIVGYKFRPVQ